MGSFTRPGPSANGYGERDKAMADALRAASTSEEADEIAHLNGLEDAADAVAWPEERS